MALYQHSAHCSIAMQWFLDENPEYWPFVPVRVADEEQERDDSAAANLPPPPINYRLSREQMIDIERFFDEKKYLKSPNLRLDLYRAAIVAIRKYHFYCR